MQKVNISGILYKTTEYGDSSLIYRFLTKEQGLIGVLAKGIRKDAHKAQLVPLCEYQLSVYEPREPSLWMLNEAYLCKDLSTYPSPATWAAAVSGLEMIGHLIVSHEEQPMVYALAVAYLEYLQNVDINAVLIFWRLYLRVTIQSGIGNPFTLCGLCQTARNCTAALLLLEGTMLCSNCLNEIQSSNNLLVLSQKSRIILDLLPEIGKHLSQLKITRKEIAEINSLFEKYWLAHHKQPMKMKSLAVLIQFYPTS